MKKICTEETFKEEARRFYDNPYCFSKHEFINDLKRFRYVGNLFEKYEKTKIINERLIINHIIVIHNLFGNFAVHGLLFKIPQEYWVNLKTYLVFLGYMPKDLKPEIPINKTLLEKLEKI